MIRHSPKHLEEQIPNHLSPTVNELMRRHLQEEYLKTLEKKQDPREEKPFLSWSYGTIL